MLESFLQAQKISVRKELGRLFRRYTTFGEEKNQLLMHQLQGLLRDSQKYQQVNEIILNVYFALFYFDVFCIYLGPFLC